MFVMKDGVLNDRLIRYEVGENNDPLSAGVYEFEYDHFGNTVKQTNTGSSQVFDFHYDFESHLVQGKVNGTLKDEFVYNGDGQRTGYRFNAQTDMYHFAQCEVTGNLLCQYWFLSGVYNAIHVNTWGDYGLVCFRSGGTTNLHFDGLGSTWAVTDSSQNITDTYRRSGNLCRHFPR
jgi:hypothetical protein